MSIKWDCAMCGGQHEYLPDLGRGVHFPTRESAQRMGYRVSPARKPPRQAPPAVLDQLSGARQSCLQRAAQATSLGFDDIAGCWTRCAADMEATRTARERFDAAPVQLDPLGPVPPGWEETPADTSDHTPALADRLVNMFTGKLEAPHEPAKKKRGRR